ncbi:hypothetical protein Tco_1358317 [Tanacetum coccineum]
MVPATAPLIGFSEEIIWPIGKTLLPVKIGNAEHFTSMDEFCGSKITISVKWDHWKARSEEDSSSPINSSRNAKILSPRRDTHSLKQQDNPT